MSPSHAFGNPNNLAWSERITEEQLKVALILQGSGVLGSIVIR
jgi:hypothetical protein